MILEYVVAPAWQGLPYCFANERQTQVNAAFVFDVRGYYEDFFEACVAS